MAKTQAPSAPVELSVAARAPRAARRLAPTFGLVVMLSVMTSNIANARTIPHWGSTLIVPASQATAQARPRYHHFKPGMVVLDRNGGRVGLITQVHQTKDGRPAVTILVNGTPITVRTAKLRISRNRDEAVISMTRSQIRTAAILNTF